MLGRGYSSTAFQAQSNESNKYVVIKMYQPTKVQSYFNEFNHLRFLIDMPYVPKVETTFQYSNYQVLVVTPYSNTVAPVLNGQRTTGKHYVHYLEALKAAHNLNICHR